MSTLSGLRNACSFQFEFVLQSGNFYLELAWLDQWFVISANERKIIRAQLEGQSPTLSWLKIDLRKTFEPLSGGRQRSNEIADIKLDNFLARSPTTIGYSDAD